MRIFRANIASIVAGGILLFGSVIASASDHIEYGGAGYQNDLLNSTRIENGLAADPRPEGKIIERIVTRPYGVILPDDAYPMFLNWVHVTTLPEVVDRELLFKVGDTWSEAAVVESAHNLRNYLDLSFAQIVPCLGSTPQSVVVLVVTKDLWSLRPNFDFLYGDGQFLEMHAQLTEQNIAGRMKTATIDLGKNLFAYYAGLAYEDPRLLGSQLRLFEQGDLIWNIGSGALEGGFATFTLQQPLYTLDTAWSWVTSVQYRKDIYRLISNGGLAQFSEPLSSTVTERVPYMLNRHRLDLQAGVTRSYGRTYKRDISAGYRGFVHLYSVPALSSPVSAATQADFESHVLPRSESAGMAYVGFNAYEGEYLNLMDLQSFALTEEIRPGWNLATEFRIAHPAFGFSSSYFEPVLSLTWTRYRDDDLFSASSGADIRYQPELASANSGSSWANGLVSAEVKNVTPQFSLFRLHAGLRGGRRFNDFNHAFVTLGSDTSLRGYPTKSFIGANYWVGNAELRTRPLAVSNVYLGLAAFYDVGGAADNLSELSPHSDAGLGLRIGLPQFNKEVLRIDLGFPFESIPGASAAYLVAQYGQAF